jgi:glucan phosphoethanolaminetransferase (alkaline phosphatase superfamily)
MQLQSALQPRRRRRYVIVTMVLRVYGAAVGTRALARSSPTTRGIRRWVARALLALPGISVALVDWTARREQIESWSRSTIAVYATTVVLGAVVWGSLVAAAAARQAWGARLLLILGSTFAIGAQLYFFARYHAYMNPRAVLVGTSLMPSVRQELWSDRTGFLHTLLVPIALAAVLPVALARAGHIPRARSRMALDLGVFSLLIAAFYARAPAGSEQAASPDILYLASMGRLAFASWRHDDAVERAHPGPRSPAHVPAISHPRGRPSVLLIVTESVRATDACSAYADDCRTTPFTNALLPDRFGFSQMRALDSTTAASLAVLWSGLPPTASRQALHTAPLLWEYAHAAGFDTAYWTSQNLLFANSGKWLDGLPLSRWASATDLDPEPAYEVGADDAKLVDRVLSDLPAMRIPFVGVVHLSNTHFPYVTDETDAPFEPQSRAFGAADATTTHNRYMNAIHRQDRLVARLVRGARTIVGSDPVIVAFVSDHGEQIRERGAIGHTWGVYDEEVRVPFWIAIPKDGPTAEQAARMRALQNVPLTQLDVLPTILDLMGIWDAPEITSFRRAMPGESLLRGGTAGRMAVFTNCSGIFACAFKNWGAMGGTKKLVATENDTHWKCFDVGADPGERFDLGPDACGDLRLLAEGDGRGTPF